MWLQKDKELEQIERTEEEILRKDDEILYLLKHRLSSIKIRFKKEKQVANTDPQTITVGQTVEAFVVGFDQNGNPYTGAIPTPTWTIDNPSFASIAADANTPANEDVTGVAAGVANLTATVQGPNGPLTDSEAVTVVVPQVLTSVQIQFEAPAVLGAAKAAKKA